MSKKKNPNTELRTARIVINLNKEEFEFIDKISRDALFSTGRHMTNNKIIMAFIDAVKELGIDGRDLHNADELKKKVLDKILAGEVERRKFPRIKKEVKVLYRKLDSMDEYQQKDTIDISQGGFRIELNEERVVGEIIEVTLIDSNMPDNPIKVFGKIIWVRTEKDTNRIEAGIKITYMLEKDKGRFNKSLSGDSIRSNLI